MALAPRVVSLLRDRAPEALTGRLRALSGHTTGTTGAATAATATDLRAARMAALESAGRRISGALARIPGPARTLSRYTLQAVTELLPAVRMTPRHRRLLPKNMGAGFLGAEMATWWALSPSLLPRPWWAIAANLAVLQAVGHTVATGVHASLPGLTPSPEINHRLYNGLHIAMGAVTVVTTVTGLHRQKEQAELIGTPRRGRRETAAGVALGTLGYGALLLLGELTQHTVARFRRLAVLILPAWVRWLSGPLAVTGLGVLVLFLGDRVVLRRILSRSAQSAAQVNRIVFPGTEQPWEPERSGSPWSHERWGSVGSQGRAVLSGGPRKDDIIAVTGVDPFTAHEPIRIFAGLIQGRSLGDQVNLIIAEMHRTGAFRRDTIAIITSTGTGWVTDWSSSALEFLTRGNSVLISMQYSYLPSALSWYKDNDAPINAARKLIDAVRAELARIPAGSSRPKLYVAGESLGAYGTAGAYGDIGALLDHVDGVVLSGTPRFSAEMAAVVAAREPDSPERLPVIDGGRNIRFVAGPEHLREDFRGLPYDRGWEVPQAIFAQHASDPVVWWDAPLFIRRPDWLRRPWVAHRDVFPRLTWIPFVTAWQITLDLLIAVDVPGGHGHNYHTEYIDYWAALLGPDAVPLTPGIRAGIESWIRDNSVKR